MNATRKTLIKAAMDAGYCEHDAIATLGAFFKAITGHLQAGRDVELRGYFTLYRKRRNGWAKPVQNLPNRPPGFSLPHWTAKARFPQGGLR
jgi:nucleoid DNA-binding protein